MLHIDELLSAYTRAGVGHKSQTRRKDVLLRLRRVLDAWLARGTAERTLKHRRAALTLLSNEVDAALLADTSPDWIDQQFGSYRPPVAPHTPGADTTRQALSKGGLPAAVKQQYLEDYKRIRALLTDKLAVRRHFQLLEDRLARNPSASLTDALEHFERQVGFAGTDVIPLGLLSTDDFFDLVRGRVAFKDVGAGIKHGENTHRLQWFVIASEMTDGFTTFPHTAEYNRSPIELYRYLSSPDLRLYDASGEYKYSLFGALFDQGGSASDLYNQPDRLHMELLGLRSWNELEDRVVRGEADYTAFEDYLVDKLDLRHLRAKLRERLRKRAAEDAAIRNAISDTDLDPYWQSGIQANRASDLHFDEDDWKRRNRWRFVPKYMADEYARRYKPHKLPPGGGSYQELGPLLVRDR